MAAPGPVPVSDTVFSQVLDFIAADTVLTSLSLKLFPDPDGNPADEPGEADAPFLWVRDLGDSLVGRDQANLMMFSVEAHDTPQHGRWTIERAMEQLEWIFNGTVWLKPTDSTRRPMRSWWMSRSALLPDEGWHTHKFIGTIQVSSL